MSSVNNVQTRSRITEEGSTYGFMRYSLLAGFNCWDRFHRLMQPLVRRLSRAQMHPGCNLLYRERRLLLIWLQDIQLAAFEAWLIKVRALDAVRGKRINPIPVKCRGFFSGVF